MTPEEINNKKFQLLDIQNLGLGCSTVGNIYFMKANNALKCQLQGYTFPISCSASYLAYIGMTFTVMLYLLYFYATSIWVTLLCLDSTTSQQDIEDATFAAQSSFVSLYMSIVKLNILKRLVLQAI